VVSWSEPERFAVRCRTQKVDNALAPVLIAQLTLRSSAERKQQTACSCSAGANYSNNVAVWLRSRFNETLTYDVLFGAHPVT